MKKILILSIIFLTTLTIFSQNFAPVGAEWYFNEKFAFSGNIDYIKFTAEKDTLINGVSCRKITKRHQLGCNNRPDKEFVFSRNDTVFLLDTIFKEFQILYVFSAKVSDKWIIKVKDEYQDVDTVFITVNSISTEQVNGNSLKAFHVTYYKSDEKAPQTYKSTILEKIGDIFYMFNWFPWSTRICDGNYTDGLRCYHDQQIGLYSTGLVNYCDYTYLWVNVEDIYSENSFDLYPNPTKGKVQVILDCDKTTKFELNDLNGRLLQSQFFCRETQIDLSQFQKGIYILTIKLNDKVMGARKIVKIE